MSSERNLEIDDPRGAPRWPVGRIVAGVFFVAVLLVNLALPKVIDSSMSRGSEEFLISTMMGLFAAQFAGVVILAGLVGASWIRGQVLGFAAGLLGFLAMAAGTRLALSDSMGDIPWSAIGMFPWFVFSASFPLVMLRQFGWRLTDRKPAKTLRQPPRIAELFHFTAVAAATLTIARVPQVAMEVEASDFWVPLTIATIMFMASSALFLPAAVYLAFGAKSRTAAILGMTVLAIICYAGILMVCQAAMGFNVAWSTRMKVVTPVVIAVSVFLGLVYPALGILARCGVRLRRAKDSPTATSNDLPLELTPRPGFGSWVVRHAELLLIVAIAIGVNIYSARLETWRRTRDEEIHRLRMLAQSLGGNLWETDRVVTGVTLQEGATDSDVEQFMRDKTLTYAHIESSKITDRSLQLLGRASELVTLTVRKANLTDDGLKALAPLRKLTTLDLSESPITGSGLAAIAATCPIANLTLDGTRFTDAQIPIIDRFVSLDVLSLDDTAVTDEGLLRLSRASQLSQIHLERTSIRGAGLRNLRVVNVVNLTGCQGITDESLKLIAGLSSMTILSLNNTSVTEAGFSHLRRLPMLASLDLSATDVTDDGVASLSNLPSLFTVRLNHTEVTGKGFRQWQSGRLKRLLLNDAQVDDSTLRILAKLNLDLLGLMRTRVTVQGILAAGFRTGTIVVQPMQFSTAERRQLEAAGLSIREDESSPDDDGW